MTLQKCGIITPMLEKPNVEQITFSHFTEKTPQHDWENTNIIHSEFIHEPKYSYYFFNQENGFALKTSELVTITKGDKSWKKWVNRYSLHFTHKVLKTGETSYNAYFRHKKGNRVMLRNVSRSIRYYNIPLFVQTVFIEKIINTLWETHPNIEEIENYFSQTKTTLTDGLNSEKFTNHPTLMETTNLVKQVEQMLAKTQSAIMYPFLLNTHKTNLVDGKIVESYTVTNIMRASNMVEVFRKIGVPEKHIQTRQTIIDNLHNLNYLNIMLTVFVNKTVKTDEHKTLTLNNIFNHPVDNSHLPHNHVLDDRMNNKRNIEYFLQLMKPVFKKTSPQNIAEIFANPETITFLYKLENPNHKKETLQVLQNLDILTLKTQHPNMFTSTTLENLIEEIRTQTLTVRPTINIEKQLTKICDNEHLATIRETALIWGEKFLTVEPAFMIDAPKNNNHLKIYEIFFNKKPEKTDPIFKFLQHDQIVFKKITNTETTTPDSFDAIFNETAYYNMLKNMETYATHICETHKIPTTVRNISYILKGYIKLDGFKNPQKLKRFTTNLKHGATLPVNLYSIKKRIPYKTVKEISAIPTEWVEAIYPQIGEYHDELFLTYSTHNLF